MACGTVEDEDKDVYAFIDVYPALLEVIVPVMLAVSQLTMRLRLRVKICVDASKSQFVIP